MILYVQVNRCLNQQDEDVSNKEDHVCISLWTSLEESAAPQTPALFIIHSAFVSVGV